MTTLRGPIEVTTDSEPPLVEPDGVSVDRNVVRETLSGSVEGTSEAQPVATRTPRPGSAADVAVEHFTSSVDGRTGSPVFPHLGIVDQGEPTLQVVIVPGSGTGDLADNSGTLEIRDADGEHTYVLTCELP